MKAVVISVVLLIGFVLTWYAFWSKSKATDNSADASIPRVEEVQHSRDNSQHGEIKSASEKLVSVPKAGVDYVKAVRSSAVRETQNLSFDDAMKWAEALPNHNLFMAAAIQIISARASRELEAVLKWYDQRKQAGSIESEFTRVVAKACAANQSFFPSQAGGYLSDKHFGDSFFFMLASVDRKDIFRFLEIPEGLPHLQSYFGSVVKGFAETENWANATKYAANITDSEVRQTALAKVAFDWALKEPEKVAGWMSSLMPEDVALPAIAGRLAAGWYQHDSNACSSWVASLPEGNMRDRAAASLVTFLSMQDTEAAKTWAESINDGVLKAECFKLINSSNE